MNRSGLRGRLRESSAGLSRLSAVIFLLAIAIQAAQMQTAHAQTAIPAGSLADVLVFSGGSVIFASNNDNAPSFPVAPPPPPTPENSLVGDDTQTEVPAFDQNRGIPTVDLAITKDDGLTSVVPGQMVTYTIVVTNAGPSDAAGAAVTDMFPGILNNVSYTSVAAGGATGNTAAGNGDINDTVTVPVGGMITYTATGTVSPGATGTLDNTATVTAAVNSFDSNLANNTATDSDTLTPTADLAITKDDGLSTVVPSQSVTYTIVVTNAGPSDAPGVTVADMFPATLTNVSYTSAAAGGATGNTAAGNGNINDTVTLPVGGMITYIATGTVSAAATGTLDNTATVTAPAGVIDPNLANNSATDSDTLTPTADPGITKDDGLTAVMPGQAVTYTIVVTNAGPSDATGVTVADMFPAILTNVSYTSAAAGGATGNTAAGNGDINDTVTVPVGGTIIYTATGTVSAGATGTLDNTATVIPPANVTDPNPENNSATDSDQINPLPPPPPQPAPPPCDPNAFGLNLLFSLIFQAPVCGFGCPLMVFSTSCGLMFLKTACFRRRRGRRSATRSRSHTES